ncbi:MAG: putative quorum-sensing-regulated virulence factor [Bacteriovorax sp.]
MNPLEQNELIKLTTMSMPFGKYKGIKLIDLPEPYVVWYYGQGLPQGELGKLLGLLYEIKLNGLEDLVRKVKN